MTTPDPFTGYQHLVFWSARLKSPAFVYVIQAGTTGPIKIGVAQDVRPRIATLQTGNPSELLLRYVLPAGSKFGAEAIERDLHARAANCRLQGEWFQGADADLTLALVAGMAETMINAYDESGKPPSYQDLLPGDVAALMPWNFDPAEIVDERKQLDEYEPKPDDWPYVSELWMDGTSEREIANALGVSVAHLGRIMADMRGIGGYELHPGARRLKSPDFGHVATPFGHRAD